MTAQELLTSVQQAETFIQNRVERAQRMKERLQSPSMCYEERIGCSGSRNNHGFDTGMDKILEYNDVTEQYKAIYVDLCFAVEDCILQLESEKYRQVLKLLYLEMKPLDSVANIMNYSTKQIRRIHKDAIAALDELLKRCPEMSLNVPRFPLNVP